MLEEVILVDEKDQPIGLMEKQQAHVEGHLHRAFSVLVFNNKGEMLIHQRALDKYHCGGLWSNACCSHPREHETVMEAAQRRLQEEMGFTTSMEHIDSFIYKVSFENGLTEHEYDHILVAHYNADPVPNPNEVADWKYLPVEEIKSDINTNPEKYTFWFQELINTHLNKILKYT